MGAIELAHVTRKYGAKVAVAGLDLAVPQGELFAFLGPNGAGKTTTIRMLAGLLRPTSGTVRVGGYDVTAHPREAAGLMGYVPDEPFLYDKLTGREFLEFIAEIRGMGRAQAAAEIARQSEQFELGGFLDDRTESYSHGMKQRLVFASVLLHDPPVLVVDEPMVGLDPKSVRLVKDLMRARAAAGKTVFMSTHTLALAEEIADRIGIVNHGRLEFLGNLDQLREGLPSQHKSLEQLFLELTAGGNGQPEGGGAAPRARARQDEDRAAGAATE